MTENTRVTPKVMESIFFFGGGGGAKKVGGWKRGGLK